MKDNHLPISSSSFAGGFIKSSIFLGTTSYLKISKKKNKVLKSLAIIFLDRKGFMSNISIKHLLTEANMARCIKVLQVFCGIT